MTLTQLLITALLIPSIITFSFSQLFKTPNHPVLPIKTTTDMSDANTPTVQDIDEGVNVTLTPEMVEKFRPEVDKFLTDHTGKLKMLLLVRKDIGMGQGKIAAQCGHAAMGIIANYLVPQHELMLLSPNRVENNWAEDVQVWYQPAMGESSDADEDEDGDYDDEDDEQCPAVSGGKPKTILELLTQKNEEMQKQSGENDDKSTGKNNETTSKTSVTTKSHTADPNDPSTRYLRLTPRQIRKELYKTTAPIEILMKHLIAKWVYRGQAKIAVKVNSDGEMDTLLRSLRNVGVPFYEIYDAGLTQIAANTRTVVAVGPFPADIIDPLLGHLKLL